MILIQIVICPFDYIFLQFSIIYQSDNRNSRATTTYPNRIFNEAPPRALSMGNSETSFLSVVPENKKLRDKFDFPNTTLLNNPEYMDCYLAYKYRSEILF